MQACLGPECWFWTISTYKILMHGICGSQVEVVHRETLTPGTEYPQKSSLPKRDTQASLGSELPQPIQLQEFYLPLFFSI